MDNLTFYDLEPAASSFRDEVLHGLTQPRKAIPPKYFYDRRGSQLFDQICTLPEYYPTRTEMALLKTHAAEIADLVGPNCVLIEYGSGSSQKIRLLLDALPAPAGYMPIDISRDHMLHSTSDLASQYPALEMAAVCADYTQAFELPPLKKQPIGQRVLFFPGSTIGNLEPEMALQLLKQSVARLDRGDSLLLGVDLKKDPAILHAAYNDSSGVTAAFNLNLLTRINRELNGNFDLAKFRHYAFYNPVQGRVEMHLFSLQEQRVQIQQHPISFRAGETIHTENSYKYTVEELQEIAHLAGFTAVKTWMDEQQLFSVYYLTVN